MIRVRDLLDQHLGCVDVVDNYTEELHIAFDMPAKLTEEGLKQFSDVLDLRVELYPDICFIDVEDSQEKLDKASKFFWSIAGYCSQSDWDKWFIYSRD